MATSTLQTDLQSRMQELRDQGLYKHEHVIDTPSMPS